MKITKFSIQNFKGISNTTVHLDEGAPGNVITLIGLNESGKTTILEAISHFITEDKDTAGLVGTVTKKSDLQDIIPKDRKAAFTGNAEVAATAILDQKDVDGLAEHLLAKHELILNKSALAKVFKVRRSYAFVDSNLVDTNAYWSIEFDLRSKKAKKYRNYPGLQSSPKEEKAIWLSAIAYLRERMPKIVYFPTFLFDFPDRIYLQNGDDPLNAYYIQVIQDVLDSQGEGLNIQKHVLDRIDKAKKDHNAIATFLAYFFQRDERKQIDAVLQKASNEMSKVIFGSWNQILGRSVTGKRVQIDWLLDAEKGNSPYLELYIVDGESKYSLSERSLGFRWFFSFLLFTEFRRNRKENSSTLFLFDEPAANLHSKAQMKLIESFSRIAQGNTYILYSTHSHYMVNPLWLENAYIIENKATDYENDDEVDSFAVRKTDINAVRYRKFVSTHPTQTTYFQPVLDALEVSFSPLISASKALIVEGKNDFYPLIYFRHKLSAASSPQIFPGNGAGSVGPLISLFRGWGVDFRVLLDGDKAGIEGKKKYIKEYMLSETEVFTLGDISAELNGKAFEAIYQDDVKQAVREQFGTDKLSKRDMALFFKELIASKNEMVFPDTEKAFTPISDWLSVQFPT